MKILFVTSGAIAYTVSSGNTFLNLFGELADTELYSLFTRSDAPDKKIKAAFRIAEAALPRHLFRRDRIGERVTASDRVLDEHAMQLEEIAKRNTSQLKYIARDILWKIAPWKNRNLRAFIEEVQPDLIVSILNENLSLGAMTAFAQKLSGAPLMLFAWDDNYSYTVGWSAPLTRLSQTVHRRHMRKMAKRADALFVISEAQKADYERIFGRSCEIMTKGADFSERPSPTPHHAPLRLLYAGNLALGRWKALAAVKEALQHINKDGMRARLHIYSATLLSDAQKDAIADGENAVFMGAAPAAEIEKLQKDADILVHAESFDPQYYLSIHHSFSTKLVDCFHCAKCLFAVGPADAASIDCLVKNDAAAVATDTAAVEERLAALVDDPALLDSYADKAWAYGAKQFDKADIKARLQQAIASVTQK